MIYHPNLSLSLNYEQQDSRRTDRNYRDNRRNRKDIRFTVINDEESSSRTHKRSNRSHRNDSKPNESEEWEIPAILAQKRSREEALSKHSPEVEEEEEEPEELQEPERKKSKKTENCRFFPNCAQDDKCPYNHPTKACNKFPQCPYGDKCLYFHPKPQHNPPQMPFVPRMPMGMPMAPPCRFGFSCFHRVTGCTFSHPLVRYNFFLFLFIVYLLSLCDLGSMSFRK